MASSTFYIEASASSITPYTFSLLNKNPQLTKFYVTTQQRDGGVETRNVILNESIAFEEEKSIEINARNSSISFFCYQPDDTSTPGTRFIFDSSLLTQGSKVCCGKLGELEIVTTLDQDKYFKYSELVKSCLETVNSSRAPEFPKVEVKEDQSNKTVTINFKS